MSWRQIVWTLASTVGVSGFAGAAEVLSFDSPALSIYTAPSASDRLCLVLDVRNKTQRPMEVNVRYEIQRIGATAGLRLTEVREAVLQIRPGGQAIEPLPSTPRCDALATVTVKDVQVREIDPATHPALAEPGGVFGPGANSYESAAVSIRAIRSPSNSLCHALDVRNKKNTPIEVLIRYDENYVAVTASMRISTPLDASIEMRPGAQMIEEVRAGVDCHPQAVLSIREVQVKDLDATANPKLAMPEGVFGSGSTSYESAILSIKTLRNPQNTLCQALSVENKTSGLLKVLIRWEERYIDVTTGMRLERPSYTVVDIRAGDLQIREIAAAPSCHPSATIVLTEVTVEQKDANAVLLPQRAPSSAGGFFAQSIAEADAAQRQRDWEAAQRELQLAQERRQRAQREFLAEERRKREERIAQARAEQERRHQEVAAALSAGGAKASAEPTPVSTSTLSAAVMNARRVPGSRYSSTCIRNMEKIESQQVKAGYRMIGRDGVGFVTKSIKLRMEVLRPCIGFDQTAKKQFDGYQQRLANGALFCQRYPEDCTEWGNRRGEPEPVELNKPWFALLDAEVSKALRDPEYSADTDWNLGEPSRFESKCVQDEYRLEVEFKKRDATIPANNNVARLALLYKTSISLRDAWISCDQKKAAEHENTARSALNTCQGIASNSGLCTQ